MKSYLLSCLTLILLSPAAALQAESNKPNFIVVLTDDQGYQDVGCFGSPDIETPHLDRMAKAGIRFTDFYAAQAVCSASRAALLTGCYPNRIGISGALGPRSTIGISDQEVTIAEMLKEVGYATAIYGKWHLGHHPKFLPTRHGFDDYFGLPYSNDMWPFHPAYVNLPPDSPKRKNAYPDLPLFDKEKIINPKVTGKEQAQLTTWYTEHAVKFIEQHKDEPFFLYVTHSMPHVPLYVSDKFAGKSKRGLYGDVIMEIDWSVGQILAAVKRHGLEENTLIVYTSDNGPWLSYGDHAGSALPLREGKGTTWDGGQREPCIMQWAGHIPAGSVCAELAGTIDLLPTFAHLAGAKLPRQIIDGKNIWPLISGDSAAKSPHEYFCFYWGNDLQAIRSGTWKLHFPHAYRSLKGKPGTDGLPGPYIQKKTELALYNLAEDLAEQKNLVDEYPEVVTRLQKYAEQAREDIGDQNRKGKNKREPGKI